MNFRFMDKNDSLVRTLLILKHQSAREKGSHAGEEGASWPDASAVKASTCLTVGGKASAMAASAVIQLISCPAAKGAEN